MTQTGYPAAFWEALEALIRSSGIQVDRPQGSAHPRFPEMRYPRDYGYLSGTRSNDRQGLDLWLGSDPEGRLEGVILTVDPGKRDAEIKLLLGCSQADLDAIQQFFDTNGMTAWVIRRKEIDETDSGSLPGPGS